MTDTELAELYGSLDVRANVDAAGEFDADGFTDFTMQPGASAWTAQAEIEVDLNRTAQRSDDGDAVVDRRAYTALVLDGDGVPVSPLVPFEVLDVASQAAASAIRLPMQLTGTLKSQADQLVRSATSAANNLAEGAGRRGRARHHHYEVAYGSAREARLIVVTVARARVVKRDDAIDAYELLDRTAAMTWRLLHPGKQQQADACGRSVAGIDQPVLVYPGSRP